MSDDVKQQRDLAHEALRRILSRIGTPHTPQEAAIALIARRGLGEEVEADVEETR